MDAVKELSVEAPAVGARWPGVLLSFLVPGFGLLRAGGLKRGMAWFLIMQAVALLFAFSIALGMFPMWLGWVALVAGLVVSVIMLRDSFRPGRMTPRLWLLLFCVIAATVFLPAPANLVAKAFKTPTGAMQPTLMGERVGSVPDHVIASRASYWFSKPKRGDIIVFEVADLIGMPPSARPAEPIYYIKRVVGLPGEQIAIRDGGIFIDGKRMAEEDGVPPADFQLTGQFGNDTTIADNAFFVIGDNPASSSDSRQYGVRFRRNIFSARSPRFTIR